jgi:hypothetical protein
VQQNNKLTYLKIKQENTMKKITLLLTMLFTSLSSQATLLSIDLNQDSYQVGDTLTADVVISDIELDYSGLTKLLASFDFILSWSDTLIEYSSVNFGSMLDVDLSFESDKLVSDNTGNVRIEELSFALSNDLFTAQDGLSSFVLASISFNVIADGTDTLELADIELGDDFGSAFTSVTTNDKAFSVTSGNPVDVPEPASIVLILMALALLIKQRKIN